MKLASSPVRMGLHSIELTVPARLDRDVSPPGQRWFGATSVTRQVEGEDWTSFNRIALWIYPKLPGWRVITVRLLLSNAGAKPVPSVFYPIAHAAHLRNEEWNRVEWELGDLPRDRVTGFSVEIRRQGHEPGATPRLTYFLDDLSLERGPAQKVVGWDVAPGKFAYNKRGYRPTFPKTALASNLPARSFQVIDARSGKTVFRSAVKQQDSRVGRFQVLDFSPVLKPGRYRLAAGDVNSAEFEIHDDVWISGVRKVLQFYARQRCGTDVPEAHRACHKDWRLRDGSRRLPLDGGWHDAGDLSQGTVNTAESAGAMLELSERLRLHKREAELSAALLEEAKWGLTWLEKTRFGNGKRAVWCTLGLWTDGVEGNNDDIECQAANSPFANFNAAATMAIAARVLAPHDPVAAGRYRRMAQEDWTFAQAAAVRNDWRTGKAVELAGAGVQAAVELYRTTGAQEYGEAAVELARRIVECQEQKVRPGMNPPLAGYFFTNTSRRRLLHYDHVGNEHLPVLALAKLAQALPRHSEWMSWYAAAALYSEHYLERAADLSGPYRVLPTGIFGDEDAEGFKDNLHSAALEQVRSGVPLGDGRHLRFFPLQPAGEKRGHFGTMLAQAKALSAAARLRSSAPALHLAQEQANWVLGRNPFASSTMYGEGHTYFTLYNAMSGQVDGALPVGIKSRENGDAPYWPPHNHPNYREVWVHVTARWLWLVADLALSPVTEPSSGTRTTGIKLLQQRSSQDGMLLTASVLGSGQHSVRLHGHNLRIQGETRSVQLDGNAAKTLSWKVEVIDRASPWVAVAMLEADPHTRAEASGFTAER